MYNPSITGYSEESGPLQLSLVEAKKEYGRLPSSYSLLPALKESDDEQREPNEVLNLDLGISIKSWLGEDKQRSLGPFVLEFFSSWHRDYQKEFGISMAPLRSLNGVGDLRRVIAANRETLEKISHTDVESTLLEHSVFKRDVLNSIPPDKKTEKGIEAILRKIASGSRSTDMNSTLSLLKARQVLDRVPFLNSAGYPLERHADDIAGALREIARYADLRDTRSLRSVSGQGTEFSYAPRDFSYLQLGRQFGDCTSDKRYLQTDCQTENIYWTVFSWILDCNYQILVLSLDGRPAIKCHMLPLFVDVLQTGRELYPCLFIDAIETTAQCRVTEENRDQLPRLQHAFQLLMAEVKAIAGRMGIASVYSERFSNTDWVRHELEKMPEVYLDTKRIVKVDELEDVFSCAASFCSHFGYPSPEAVFMEIQARNTYLIAESIMGTNKSFALVLGDPADGLPAKYAFGV